LIDLKLVGESKEGDFFFLLISSSRKHHSGGNTDGLLRCFKAEVQSR